MARVRWSWVAIMLGLATWSAAADLDEIRGRGTLRVVVWRDNLPELYAAKGVPSGLEQEVIAGFARLQKLGVELLAVPGFDDRIPALLEGRGDLVAGGLVNTEARRKLVDFTTEIFPIRHLAISRKPEPSVESLDQLRARTVGTIKNSSWAEEVVRAGVPPARVVDRYASADEVLAGLRSGEVSAVVMSAVWAVVEQRKDPSLQLGMLLGPATSVGFGVPKDAPRLRAELDAYIHNLRRTPTWSRLVVKYFGESGLQILRASRGE